jgi:hypothetical protein
MDELSMLRMAAQRLVGPPAAGPLEAVRLLTAVQGQELPGALLSVTLRSGSTRAQVTAALDDGSVVRSWPMRGTLHLTAAADLPWLLDLLTERAVRGVEKRRAIVELTEADVERAREVAVAALTGGGAMSRAELLAALVEAGVPATGPRGYHLLWWLSQTGSLVMGPTRDGDQLFVLLGEWVPTPRRLDREEALGELALRYFRGHGPATVQDLTRWAYCTVRDVQAGLALAREHLETLTVDGTEHLMDPGTPERLAAARAQAEGVHLLPGFDELVLGYADRSCTVPAEHAQRIVPGSNGVFRPTVVAGGRVVATWRTGRGKGRPLEVEPFGEPAPGLTAAVEERFATLP